MVLGCPPLAALSGSIQQLLEHKHGICVWNAAVGMLRQQCWVLPSQGGLIGCSPRLEGSCLCVSQLLSDWVCHFIPLCDGFLGIWKGPRLEASFICVSHTCTGICQALLVQCWEMQAVPSYWDGFYSQDRWKILIPGRCWAGNGGDWGESSKV